MNIIATMFMLSMGVQTAACSCIGQQIGRQNIQKAKEYMRVLNHTAFVLITASVLSLLIYKKQIIGIFTNIESVKEQCYAVIGIAAMGTFPDMWQGYLQGPVKALGI